MSKRGKKIDRGVYEVRTKMGRFTIRNTGGNRWVILNEGNRRITSPFPTLAGAHSFLTGLNVKPASEKAKRYLRDLLTEHKGQPLAEQIRDYFNDQRRQGKLIRAEDVSLAIKRLTGRSLPLPAQQRVEQSVMPRAEAIAMARAALVGSK